MSVTVSMDSLVGRKIGIVRELGTQENDYRVSPPPSPTGMFPRERSRVACSFCSRLSATSRRASVCQSSKKLRAKKETSVYIKHKDHCQDSTIFFKFNLFVTF